MAQWNASETDSGACCPCARLMFAERLRIDRQRQMVRETSDSETEITIKTIVPAGHYTMPASLRNSVGSGLTHSCVMALWPSLPISRIQSSDSASVGRFTL